MRKLSFILISFFVYSAQGELPKWITSGSAPDTEYAYVVCSAEGLDPQNIQQTAENNCMASAAKLQGVKVTVSEKTVQGVAGVDSSKVAQIAPIQSIVKCEWSHRYLESIGTSFRLWLECRIERKSVSMQQLNSEEKVIKNQSSVAHAKALITLVTVPRADVIAILGDDGERVINPTSNSSIIEIHSGDEAIEIRKIGYKSQKKPLPNFVQGDSLTLSFQLERDK